MIKINKVQLAAIAASGLFAITHANADNAFSGAYLGAGLGLEKADFEWETTATFTPDGQPMAPRSATEESLSDSSSVLSIFAGYNFPLSDKVIIGAEVAYSATDFSDDIPDRIPGLGQPNNPNSFSEVEAGDNLRFGIRGGYLLADDLMLFTTISRVEMDAEWTTTCPADTTVCNPSFGTQSFSDEEELSGWALGLGVEKAFGSNLLVRGEYRYSDYGDFDFTAFPFDPNSRFGAEAEIEAESDALEIGVSYLF